MALFKVNTGLCDQEVCQLRWEWEYPFPELNRSVFVIPGANTRNGLDRWVPLNDIAWQVITEVRHQHPAYVFIRADRQTRVCQMSNKAWKRLVIGWICRCAYRILNILLSIDYGRLRSVWKIVRIY